MNKPKPIVEMAIKIHSNDPIIDIFCASADAISWVEKNAPEFGLLHRVYNYCTFMLVVYPNYKTEEVAKYLMNGMNDDTGRI